MSIWDMCTCFDTSPYLYCATQDSKAVGGSPDMLGRSLRWQKIHRVRTTRPASTPRIRHASTKPPSPNHTPNNRPSNPTTYTLASAIRAELPLLARWLTWATGLTLTYHIVATYFIEYGPCSGISMLPTYAAFGDSVVISKWYRRGRGVQVGDVVSYAHPIEPGERAIKRVLGMPGDFVLRDTPGVGDGMMMQVPQGHCWVAGDNLKHSRDSRLFGPLPLALVKGRVLYRVPAWSWPIKLERGLPGASMEEGVD